MKANTTSTMPVPAVFSVQKATSRAPKDRPTVPLAKPVDMQLESVWVLAVSARPASLATPVLPHSATIALLGN
jgi:hypothetical protein